LAEYFVNYPDKLIFIQQGITADNINIALKEFAVPAFLGTIGPPHRLDLISFEGENDLITMLDDISGEGYCKVIP
jgi:hypothetical protein